MKLYKPHKSRQYNGKDYDGFRCYILRLLITTHGIGSGKKEKYPRAGFRYLVNCFKPTLESAKERDDASSRF